MRAQRSIWTTSGHSSAPDQKQIPARGQPGAWPLAPRFSVEPAALVEYSNSSGATLHCRPQVWASPAGRTPAQWQPRVEISWRRLELDSEETGAEAEAASGEEQEEEQEEEVGAAEGTSREQDRWLEWAAEGSQQARRSSSGAPDSSQLLQLRPDGSLAFRPFAAKQLEPRLHWARYRCCLTQRPRGPTVCSRPVQTKAG